MNLRSSFFSSLALLSCIGLLMAAAPTEKSSSLVNIVDSSDMEMADIAKAMKKCAMCHAKDFHGKKKSPAIAGEKAAKIVASLTTKIPKKMQKAVAKLALTKAQVAAIAAKLSKMKKKAE